MVDIRSIDEFPPPGLTSLLDDARVESVGFFERLVTEWETGLNRFDQPGESLLGAFVDGQLVGVCGLNTDPYAANPRIARVRHLYVRPQFRRMGIATALVAAIAELASPSFRQLRLRTHAVDARQFYAALGFRPVAGDSWTHERELADTPT